MTTTYVPMDISKHLDNEEVIAEYLSAALEEPDMLSALADVAKARGVQPLDGVLVDLHRLLDGDEV